MHGVYVSSMIFQRTLGLARGKEGLCLSWCLADISGESPSTSQAPSLTVAVVTGWHTESVDLET